MREKELEEKFAHMVRKAGGKACKFVSPGNGGVPDRLVVLPGGRTGFAELKQPGKKPRKLQEYRIRELRDLGCFTGVVDSEASAALFIRALQSQQMRTPDTFAEMVNRAPYRRND